MKKCLAILLCISMLCAICPVWSGAEEAVLQTIFRVDFEKESVGGKPKKGLTNWMISNVAENVELGNYVRIGEEAEGGNKVLHLYRTSDSSRGAGIRASCNLHLEGFETLTASLRTKSVGADSRITMYTAAGEVALATVTSEDWVTVQMDFDLPNRKCYVKIGDEAPNTVTLKEDCASNTAILRFAVSNMQPGTGVYYDDIFIGTYDEDVYIRQSPAAGGQEVYWQYVLPNNPISEASYVSNLNAHPRVFVRDWDEMRAKIDDSMETQMWYANIKATADKALSTSPQKYVDNNGHLKLYAARNARDRMQALAFVYNIEQDERYFNKAYEEMLYYGDYKNWSGFGQTLVCAEILNGMACAYDWLYDQLDDETQKPALIEIMKNQAFAGYVYNYEGMMSWSFSNISINWNPVCNASMMMAALAIADEEPEMSEYFLEMALPSLKLALSPYAPQGAYPEGVSYWDYGTSFLVFACDMLEHAFKESFVIPQEYRYWEAEGLAETCDFGIYMNGPAGRFDYGDCVAGYTSCEVLYWAAEKYNKPHYAWWQNNIQAETGSYLSGYPAIAALVWYNPENAEVEENDFTLDKFYDAEESKFNGFSMRSSWQTSSALFTAMQGGYNKGSHLHQTLGTYVVDHNGKRFICQADGADYDLANEEASKNIYGHRAESGNCLVINPSADYDQKYGAFAPLSAHDSNKKSAYGILDMTNVYANQIESDASYTVTSAKRGLKLTHARSRIVVQDEVTLASPSEVYWFANTDAAVTIAQDGRSAVLDIDGDKMLVRMLSAPDAAAFELMDRKTVVAEGVLDNNTSGRKKLAIHLENQVGDLTIAVEYVPLTSTEQVPGAPAVLALADWTDDFGLPTCTETTYVTEGDELKFTTCFSGELPKSGYLVVSLYESGMPVGIKMVPYTGESCLTSRFANRQFDEVKVMFIESVFSMRILAAPEIL